MFWILSAAHSSSYFSRDNKKYAYYSKKNLIIYFCRVKQSKAQKWKFTKEKKVDQVNGWME